MYCLFCVVLCIVRVYMCTVLLPPGGYPIAVKYIIYHKHSTAFRGRVFYVQDKIVTSNILLLLSCDRAS